MDFGFARVREGLAVRHVRVAVVDQRTDRAGVWCLALDLSRTEGHRLSHVGSKIGNSTLLEKFQEGEYGWPASSLVSAKTDIGHKCFRGVAAP